MSVNYLAQLVDYPGTGNPLALNKCPMNKVDIKDVLLSTRMTYHKDGKISEMVAFTSYNSFFQ